MAAIKKTNRRTPTPRTNPKTLLDRHGSTLKLFANYGFAGLAFGYLLIFTIPDAQETFTAALEKQADQNREDRKTAFNHAEHAVEKLSSSIDGLSSKWSTVQSVTQDNQRELIAAQHRTNQILTQQLDDSPAEAIASPPTRSASPTESTEPPSDWQPVRQKTPKKATN